MAETRFDNLAWSTKISIGKGPIYVFEEIQPKGTQDRRVAGWVQLNEGKYEAGVPDSHPFIDAIKIGLFNTLEEAQSAVERHVPEEKEWIYL